MRLHCGWQGEGRFRSDVTRSLRGSDISTQLERTCRVCSGFSKAFDEVCGKGDFHSTGDRRMLVGSRGRPMPFSTEKEERVLRKGHWQVRT